MAISQHFFEARWNYLRLNEYWMNLENSSGWSCFVFPGEREGRIGESGVHRQNLQDLRVIERDLFQFGKFIRWTSQLKKDERKHYWHIVEPKVTVVLTVAVCFEYWGLKILTSSARIDRLNQCLVGSIRIKRSWFCSIQDPRPLQPSPRQEKWPQRYWRLFGVSDRMC